MVVNYEARWTSQYEAIAGYPAEGRLGRKRWKDAWPPPVLKDADGQSYKERPVEVQQPFVKWVKTQRAKEETGSTVENYLRTGGPGWNARLVETTNEGMPIHRMLWMKRGAGGRGSRRMRYLPGVP
jgi:hypothetical protein